MQSQPTQVRRRPRGGFTLLEVLIVLAIIGVIAAMVVPNVIGQMEGARISATQNTINGVESAADLFMVANSRYAETIDEMVEGTQDVNGRQIAPQLKEYPLDAWGNQIFYEYPNQKSSTDPGPAIWSAGPNMQDESGSGDDIINWTL